MIKAAATALQLVPEVNLNTVGEDDYQIMSNIDISVAVATPNGLITPIVKDVVTKSLPDISDTVRDLALRARDGKLQLQEFQVRLSLCRKELKKNNVKEILKKNVFCWNSIFSRQPPIIRFEKLF